MSYKHIAIDDKGYYYITVKYYANEWSRKLLKYFWKIMATLNALNIELFGGAKFNGSYFALKIEKEKTKNPL